MVSLSVLKPLRPAFGLARLRQPRPCAADARRGRSPPAPSGCRSKHSWTGSSSPLKKPRVADEYKPTVNEWQTKRRPPRPRLAKNGQHGTPADAKPPNPLRKLAAASRLPALPKTHFRVVIRPGGGLNVQAGSQHKVFNALVMAAQLPPHATEEDIVCANAIQNIFVLSTPQETNALAYCTVQEIILTKQRHPVTTYLAPPGNTCRGVIRGVDADFTDADLQRMLCTDRNPKVLGARRIKSTTTVIILFDGHKVPNYVYCGPIMYRCTLYKRQIDTCCNCGRVGHRQDVCPHPADKVCDQCGNGPPGPTHVCTSPECALCGGAHLTGDRTCRSRYQVPYLVRHRRQRRRRRNKQRTTQDATTGPTPQDCPQAYNHSSTPACRPNPARQLTRPGRLQAYVGRQGRREIRAPSRSVLLLQPVADKIQFLERENANLRKELTEIKALLQAPQPREPRESTAQPAAPPTVRGAKRRAAPEQADEEPLTMSSIMAHMTALLEQFRSDILVELNPIKLQSNELSARLQILEADRHHMMQGRQIHHQ
ncbi:hypothetical protein MTO96_048741 [Rhipicephalus appendiculatus]